MSAILSGLTVLTSIRWGTILAYKDSKGNDIKKDIVELAAMKILGGKSFDSATGLDEDQKFACLCQRLPIERSLVS